MGYDAWVNCRCAQEPCAHPSGELANAQISAWGMAALHELAQARQLPTLQACLPQFNGGWVPIEDLAEFRAELASIVDAPVRQTVLEDADSGAELLRFDASTKWWWRYQGHGADVEDGRVHLWAPDGRSLWTAHFRWHPGDPASIEPLDVAGEPLAWYGPDLADEVRCRTDIGASAAVMQDATALLQVVDAGLATGEPVHWG